MPSASDGIGYPLITQPHAPGLGFEPRLPGPEPGVLPLDDPGIADVRSPKSTG